MDSDDRDGEDDGSEGSGGSGGGLGSGGVDAGLAGSGGESGSGGDLGRGGAFGSGGELGSGDVSGNGGTSGHWDSSVDLADVPIDLPQDGPDRTDAVDMAASCAGVADSQICWYLGKSGDSCAMTCASHGGTAARAASHIGVASQGGSPEECGRLFGLLGVSGPVVSGTRSDAVGVGCFTLLGLHVYLTAPPYADSARYSGAQIVCGCVR
jgi:hypothetical protein